MPKHDNIHAALMHFQVQHAVSIYRAMHRLLDDGQIDTARRRLEDNYYGDNVIADIIDIDPAFVGAMRWYFQYGVHLDKPQLEEEKPGDN